MQTVIVTENPEFWCGTNKNLTPLSPLDYVTTPPNNDNESIRVINLCKSYNYQSLGYYVSLLAQARGHKVIPSVLTIQDFKSRTSKALIAASLDDDIQQAFKTIKSEHFELSVYFGKNTAKHYDTLCRKLHGLLPTPLFRVSFIYKKKWLVQKIELVSYQEIPKSHHEFVLDAAAAYFDKKRFYPLRKKAIYYDVAMLVNPKETTPPSNPTAIEKFIEMGSELGIQVDLIGKDDFKTLNEYDGLFIRETTAVDHHTYQFARRAAAERLVVLDDPVSILRCANKVYLAELLQTHNVPTPQTTILSKNLWKSQIKQLSLPCVLKQPDSAFSQGVVKVHTKTELSQAATDFFKESDLIIAQPFMPSEFDWRIGIIDNKPLFACRYYMAKDHWQIYNWQSADATEGDSDTIAVEKVPDNVINTALKATKLIGDGLYGVDLKQIGDKVYVIEVNDNPNVDHDVEDIVLGDALYTRIMAVFLERMKRQRGYA